MKTECKFLRKQENYQNCFTIQEIHHNIFGIILISQKFRSFYLYVHTHIYLCFLYVFSLAFWCSFFNPTDKAELQSSILLTYSLIFHLKLPWSPVGPVLPHCIWNKMYFSLSFASLEHISEFGIENYSSDEYF